MVGRIRLALLYNQPAYSVCSPTSCMKTNSSHRSSESVYLIVLHLKDSTDFIAYQLKWFMQILFINIWRGRYFIFS